jgi:hypothetical protein
VGRWENYEMGRWEDREMAVKLKLLLLSRSDCGIIEKIIGKYIEFGCCVIG